MSCDDDGDGTRENTCSFQEDYYASVRGNRWKAIGIDQESY